MAKIYAQKTGSWNRTDRLALASLLIKAGYKVRVGKERPEGKSSNVLFVEYEEQSEE